MEKRRYKIKPPEVWTQVRKDYLSGLDAKTVAARHDVTEASIRARATKEGWSRHPRSEAATPAPQPLSPQDAADLSPEDPNDPAALARAAAQRACSTQYLDTLEAGSVIPCTVTHIENFGAFCDVGCGISALLPIDCLSVSRISSPADRVSVGQQLLCAIKTRDVQGRIVLTLRELLGTWSENAACFAAGETVVGIVRSVEEYGVFIEIAPNLAGLAEPDASLKPGQSVSVYIKSILPDKMKIKLVVVNKNLGQALRFEPHYFVTKGRLKHWTYSTPQSRKQIETVF